MTPCRFFYYSKPTISWIWVSNPTSGESSEARSARPVRVGSYTSWPASSKRGTTFCQHQPPCQPPCTSTNVAMFASFFDFLDAYESENRKKDASDQLPGSHAMGKGESSKTLSSAANSDRRDLHILASDLWEKEMDL